MTQHSVKKGLRTFGEAGKEAVCSKTQQLHEMGAVEPKKSNMLTREEKSKALNCLMFLNKSVVDGSKEGDALTAASNDSTRQSRRLARLPLQSSFLVSCDVEAKEGRTVITADTPGAFVQTDADQGTRVR
jgi:hypothetical protein